MVDNIVKTWFLCDHIKLETKVHLISIYVDVNFVFIGASDKQNKNGSNCLLQCYTIGPCHVSLVFK